MTQADFWRTLFQSHYFTMDRIQTSHAHDLFADCAGRDDKSKKLTFSKFEIPFSIEIHDEAERASRRAMAVIAPEADETSEVRLYDFYKAFV